MLRIELEDGDGFGRRLDEAAEQMVRVGRRRIGEEAVAALRGPRSYWPVDTGYSKTRFRFDVRGDNVEIGNTAPYAKYVEARPGRGREARPAYRTIRAQLPRIIREIERGEQ